MSDEGSTILDLASFVARSPEVVQRDRFHLWVVPGVPVEYDTLAWSDIDEDKDIPKSFRARTILWGQGMESFMSSPILGIGLGKARFSAIPYDSKTFDGAFNIWITLLAETGLVGCLAFLNVIWFFAALAIKLFRKSSDKAGRVLAATFLSALVGYMLHCLVEDMVFAVMDQLDVRNGFGIVVRGSQSRLLLSHSRRRRRGGIKWLPYSFTIQ